MSNTITGVDISFYTEILKMVPRLGHFLRSENVLFEYILCLNDYNIDNNTIIPYNNFQIKMDPKSVINWSFDWASGNNMLYNNNIQFVMWGKLHSKFYSNYFSYNDMTFNTIKII